VSKSEEKEMKEEALKKAQVANENRNSERLKLMEQIADTSETGRTEDIEGIEKEQLEAETTAKALQEEGAEPEKQVEEAIPGDEKDINGVKHFLTIVNGQEKWLTLQQLREKASKVEAADEYLRTAAEAARTAAAVVPSKDEPPSLGEDEIAELLRKQALGDDEATRALAKALAKPSVTPDVLQALDQRLSFRTELAELEAKSRDLLEDPYMGRLFKARLNELKQTAPNTRLAEAYTSIDKELRTAFPGYKAGKLQDKLERKRTLPQVPTASARQVQEAEEEGEEDAATVIERMAKARGISPHVHPRRQ
jgi:hypothetical protein